MSGFSLPDMYRMHYTQPIEQAALEATIEIVELEAWYNDDIQCESAYHPSGQYGHAPSAPASYLVKFQCCGASKKMCAGWVHAMPSYPYTICFACDTANLAANVITVPI